MIKKILMWVGVVFVVLVIIAIFTGGESKNSTSNSVTSTSPTQEPVEDPAIEVTANQLLKAYKNNEVAANQQYKGKVLLVSGVVDSIQAGLNDKPYISLKAGGEFEFNTPQARLIDSDEAKAATLSKGQKILLKCIGDSEVAGTPMLKDCVIQ